jgi:hypothetical protein
LAGRQKWADIDRSAIGHSPRDAEIAGTIIVPT